MAKIILTGGGSAGHCTPHLSILPYLEKKFSDIIYIGSKNGIEKQIIQKKKITYFEIECTKLYRKFNIKNLGIPIKLSKGIIQAGKILDKEKPSVIFSKGGYVALPVVIAGAKRNIPIITHESDLTIGLANKIIAKYANKILTTFNETTVKNKNVQFVGPPINNKIFNCSKEIALKFFNLSGNKPILLITGGSQGAKTINNIVRNSLPFLLKTYDIIHLCGKNNIAPNIDVVGYKQYEFLDNIEYAYTISSVCVSRAGSNTLFELLALKKPCVIIPLPQGNSRGDQVQNANYFYKKGMINLLEQDKLTEQTLSLAINNAFKNKQQLIKNINDFSLASSSMLIADILSSYI